MAAVSTLSIATVCLLAAGWTDAVEILPKPEGELVLVGDDAPSELVLMPSRDKSVLSVAGPTALTLTFYGLRKRRGRRWQGPGEVTLSVDDGPLKVVILEPEPTRTWRVQRHPKWQVTQATTVTLTLDEGPHIISLAPSNNVAVGYGLHVGLSTPELPAPATELEAAAPADAVAGAPEPETEAPPLPAPEPPPEPATLSEGFAVTSSPTPSHTVRGPNEEASFLDVAAEQGLELAVVGPGVMVLDLHAHRAASRPETLRPIVVGILLDDTLVQTVGLDQPAGRDYVVDDVPYELSRRIGLRLPVSAGSHTLSLSLSDNAIYGISVRPRFEAGGSEEPALLSATEARQSDVRVRPSTSDGRVAGALWLGLELPWHVGAPGTMALIEGSLGLPALEPDLALALATGFGWAAEHRSVADLRSESGSTRLHTTVRTVPLLADLRWRVALPQDLELHLGAGGGMMLAWYEVRALGGGGTPELLSAAVLSAHLGISRAIPGGNIALRAQLLAGQSANATRVRELQPGGLLFLLGYELGR